MLSKTLADFNPRPREEGDGLTTDIYNATGNISIHALVKRATVVSGGTSFSTAISIHALVKRATDVEYGCSFAKIISIHALVKRAT